MSMYGMKIVPPEAQCLFRQGRELQGQKRYEAAVKCLRQAVLIAPRFDEADRQLQDCLTLLERQGDIHHCSAEYLS
jgi:hypothetical protein